MISFRPRLSSILSTRGRSARERSHNNSAIASPMAQIEGGPSVRRNREAPDGDTQMIDSSGVRVHQDGARQKGVTRGDRRRRWKRRMPASPVMAPRRRAAPPASRPPTGVTRPCGPGPEISEFGALRKFKPAAINPFTRDGGNDRNA
jgi:hypothetical protein